MDFKKYLEKFTKAIGVVVIILFCASCILLSIIIREIDESEFKNQLSIISTFENIFYDYRMKQYIFENPPKKSDKITLVTVDDKTLEALGTFPIPRDNYARLLERLDHFNARGVGIDIFFPEESLSCPGVESTDDIFASAVADFHSKEGRNFILAYTLQSYLNESMFDEVPGDLFNFILDSKQNGDVGMMKSYVERTNYPIQKLVDTGADLAYINMKEDQDGVFRNYKLVSNVDDLYFPSLALRGYEVLTGIKPTVEIGPYGNGTMKFGEQDVYISNLGEVKIRWPGDLLFYDHVSMIDVINAKDNDPEMKKLLENRLIFWGSTTTGAHDFRNSPIDSKMPGVLAHMSMLYMLTENFFYQSLEDSVKYSFLFMTLGLMILLSVMLFGNPVLDIIALVFVTGATLYIDNVYFLPDGYELKLFYTLLSFILSYSWITFLSFNQTSQEKKQIKGAFSRYVAPSIVNDMLDHPDKLKVGGEKRDITCLFSDVRDFTSISEKLTPNELASALNRYMGEMTDIVFATEGTLDKYIGDAIVAFWGAPIEIDDHVNQSVDAAVQMLEALPNINDEFRHQGLPEFKIGLGLNSGECSVGNMGSDQIFAYTALGDNMNLGARLESLCKHYGAQILISEFTYERMDHERFTSRLIDKVKVKGKERPVGVYEVLYSYHPFMVDKDSLQKFNQAYQYFVAKEFEKARELLEAVSVFQPEDKSTKRLLQACLQYIEVPPAPNEDHTITTMTTK